MMKTNNQEIDLEKEKFLKWQFFLLTILASFRRNEVYVADANPKHREAFRETLFQALNGIGDSDYVFQSPDSLISAIRTIQHQSKNFDHILKGGQLNFGTCQKMVNLYLKYLWCAGLLDNTPVHFPLDRIIQKGTDIESWTKLGDEDELKYLDKINELCPEDNKAEWELIEYNKQFYK